ncbi:MAG: N-acetyl-gamma-glutamyl-phosphate reductase, partial [Trichodesmium sp. St11_bin5]|nr:N-acetyl-gamma-glutamyl-phosphate reductase [Trichodesmium sp. St11_bin5]
MKKSAPVPIGIVGASGYGGVQLVKLLQNHPKVEVVYLGGDSSAGKPFSSIYPHLEHSVDLKIESIELDKIANKSQIVFLSLPNGLAWKMAPNLLEKGCKVLDLSADYRFSNLETYQSWYGGERTDQKIAATAVYGLPEL